MESTAGDKMKAVDEKKSETKPPRIANKQKTTGCYIKCRNFMCFKLMGLRLILAVYNHNYDRSLYYVHMFSIVEVSLCDNLG